MALMVRVYHLLFAGCPMDSDDTVITLVEPGTSPSITKLEGAHHNIECWYIYYIYALLYLWLDLLFLFYGYPNWTPDVMSHDAVKRLIALREDWIKNNVHSASRVSSGVASVRYMYDYLFWIRIVIVTISCQFSLD